MTQARTTEADSSWPGGRGTRGYLLSQVLEAFDLGGSGAESVVIAEVDFTVYVVVREESLRDLPECGIDRAVERVTDCVPAGVRCKVRVVSQSTFSAVDTIARLGDGAAVVRYLWSAA